MLRFLNCAFKFFKERAKTSHLCGAVLGVYVLFPYVAHALETKDRLKSEVVQIKHVTPSLKSIMQDQRLVGNIHYSYWFWSVYDAYLYSKDGKFGWNKNFVLKLKYLRDFTGKSIVDETIEQIHKQQGDKVPQTALTLWEKELIKIFPDIKENDQLIGVYDIRGITFFYNGKGKFLGKVKGQPFAKSFFDIWLGDNAQEADLSRKLRGL